MLRQPKRVTHVDSTEYSMVHGKAGTARLHVLQCTYRHTSMRTADILLTANTARFFYTMFLKFPTHFNVF
jgi:hypothetical protein